LHIDMGLEAVLPGPQNALYVMFFDKIMCTCFWIYLWKNCQISFRNIYIIW